MVGVHNRPNYFAIWIWLVGLVIVSVAASAVLPKAAGFFLIFAIAATKALLVILNYMHLRYERLILSSLVLVPLLIVVVLLFLLFPDFVFRG